MQRNAPVREMRGMSQEALTATILQSDTIYQADSGRCAAISLASLGQSRHGDSRAPFADLTRSTHEMRPPSWQARHRLVPP